MFFVVVVVHSNVYVYLNIFFYSGDEIEKSIEFLDKVLSEFEEPDSLPHIEQEPETPTQGNQSEDDGYMSMNGKK